MRNLLTRDFPAAVVPPLPDKHRMGTSTDNPSAALELTPTCRQNTSSEIVSVQSSSSEDE